MNFACGWRRGVTTLQLPQGQHSLTLHMEPGPDCVPDEGVSVWWRGRHLGVVQILLGLTVGVEARRHHGVAVLLQQLTDESPTDVRRQSSFLAVHALPLHQ